MDGTFQSPTPFQRVPAGPLVFVDLVLGPLPSFPSEALRAHSVASEVIPVEKSGPPRVLDAQATGELILRGALVLSIL